MAKTTKMDAMRLTTPQEVWDYYNVVNGLPKEDVEEDVIEWINPILNRYDETDIKYVLDAHQGIDKMVVFDLGYFDTVLDAKKAKEELAKVKPTTSGVTDYALSVLSEAMVKSLEQTKEAELMNWFKTKIYAEYGIEKKPVQVVSVKGKKIEGIINQKAFDRCAKWLQLNEPIFMTGPAGTGKNTLVSQLCEAYGYQYFSANALKQPFEMTGFNNVNGYQDTQFYKACCVADKGKDVVFFLDEFDSCESDVTPVFNDAISSGVFTFPNNETKKFGEHLRFIAAGNTWGTGATSEYVGRNKLDAATLNRFVVVPVDYTPEIEEGLCEDPVLLKFLREFRQGIYNCGLEHIVSYRNIRQAAKHFSVFGKDDIKEVLEDCLIKNLTKDDLGQIQKYLSDNEFARVIKDMAEDY